MSKYADKSYGGDALIFGFGLLMIIYIGIIAFSM